MSQNRKSVEVREHAGANDSLPLRGHLSKNSMNRCRGLKLGFTLIELLVVIAIIAILAAIIFPVFARAKDGAYRSSDMSNMNAIRTALQLYRADQGAYPPALLGYATTYLGGVPSAGNVIPANLVAGALYPKRIDSMETLRPAYVRPKNGSINLDFTSAVWPQGLSPQRFGPGDGNVQTCYQPTDGSPFFTGDAYFYRISGYDAAEVKTPMGEQVELRYAKFWSNDTLGLGAPDACKPGPGSASDSPRQLGYSEPPETTVITWDSYFRDYNGGVPERSKRDIVLFLSGTARPFDSVDVSNKAWQVQP